MTEHRRSRLVNLICPAYQMRDLQGPCRFIALPHSAAVIYNQAMDSTTVAVFEQPIKPHFSRPHTRESHQNALHPAITRRSARHLLHRSISSSLSHSFRRLWDKMLRMWHECVLYRSPLPSTQLITIDLVGAFGEGTNVAILTNDTSKALTGQFNNTYWTFNGFSKIHSLYMEPTASSKEYPRRLPVLSSARKSNALTLEIADYGKVGINSGLATKGFSEGDEDGLLVWNNTDMANVGSWFAFCPTLIPGHESAGLQDRVYWQSNEAPAEGTNNCTTVVIHGAFE